MAYTKTNWTSTTPVNTTNLNKIEDGISANDSSISEMLGNIYPVGSIIIRDSSTDMSNWLGFTWEKVFAGKVLVGVDPTDTDFNTIGKTGGEKEHTLTIDEMPSHSHKLNGNTNVVFDESSIYPYLLASAKRGYASGSSVIFGDGYTMNDTTNTGGGQAHNNLQPYQVVAYWKRTA